MNSRATPILAILLLGVLTVSGSERVPVVVGVHRSPGDLRSIRVVDGRIVATTADGGWWSASIEDVAAAIRQPSNGLTPSWATPPPGGPLPVGAATEPFLRAQVDGYPVTARAHLAGEAYTATLGGGLYRSPGDRVASSPPEIHDLAVVDGQLLLAHSGGLAAFDGAKTTPVRLTGPPVNDITALEWADDTLWVGSFEHGLAFYRMDRWEKARTIPDHGGDWINSLCWDGATLWVGSAAGLGSWDPIDGRVVPETRLEGRVQAIRCADREDAIVVATGAAIWIGSRQGWERVDLTGEALHTAVRFRGGLWAAGLRGIMRRRGGAWERDTELNGRLPDSWITALLPDGDFMWAGTYDSGLLRTDRSGRWRTVVRNAWVNPNAIALTPTGVAAGTMGDGLLLHDAETGHWQRLTSAGGLPSDDVTAVRPAGDILWVGTRSGIAEVRWAELP